jgi:hypothetical protein
MHTQSGDAGISSDNIVNTSQCIDISQNDTVCGVNLLFFFIIKFCLKDFELKKPDSIVADNKVNECKEQP